MCLSTAVGFLSVDDSDHPPFTDQLESDNFPAADVRPEVTGSSPALGKDFLEGHLGSSQLGETAAL